MLLLSLKVEKTHTMNVVCTIAFKLSILYSVNLIRLVVDFFLNSNMEDGKVRYCVFLLCRNEIQKKWS